MSVDLDFWRYKDGVEHQNDIVYQTACCDGKLMESLDFLPIDQILKKISTVFSEWIIQDNGKNFEKEGHGAFEIFTTAQMVRLNCYHMQKTDINSLIDILIDFGCPLYDPQISTRFDSWTDR